jgi:hypothetical protein
MRTDGRTDRLTDRQHDEANSFSSKFCERAEKVKIFIYNYNLLIF